MPDIAAVAPVSQGTAQLVYGPGNWSTAVIGTMPDYFTARDWTMASGNAFTDGDVRSATRVAVLGQTVVSNLFGDEDPVGKTIRIKNSPFLVIGELEPKGQSLTGAIRTTPS